MQTRGDVYSAETSKSAALGCNLVTSFSLLLPAPAPGSATPGAHWPSVAAELLLSPRTESYGINLVKEDDTVCLVGVRLIFQEIMAHTAHKECDTGMYCCVTFSLFVFTSLVLSFSHITFTHADTQEQEEGRERERER